MITGLGPYRAMKDTGVPWLGKVPEHWQVRRMKFLVRERVQKGFPNEPLLAATQSKGVVRKEQYENRTALALKDLHFLKLVRIGDFVISLRSFQGGIEYAREQGIISPAYTILYPTRSDTHGYLAWLFKSKPYIDNLSIYVTGIRQGQNIDYERLGRSELPIPSLPERIAIVRFLDHSDRRIRRYIRAKQRLIKLLEDQKQAMIHHAVTRGLDPHVRLKPSGVEWLGDVPEHWKIAPIKRAFVSMDYGISEPQSDSGNVHVLTMANIRQGRVMVPESGGVDEVEPDLLLRPGDLLFNRTNSSALVGKVGLFTGADAPVTFASYLVRMRPHPMYSAQYLNLMLNDYAVLSAARREAIPSLQQSNLNPTRYGRLPVALPPFEEQVMILEKLGSQLREHTTAVEAAQRELPLLREFRTRLIADVVTGKLDVREAAAWLEDPGSEPEPLADIEPDADDVEAQLDHDLSPAAEDEPAA